MSSVIRRAVRTGLDDLHVSSPAVLGSAPSCKGSVQIDVEKSLCSLSSDCPTYSLSVAGFEEGLFKNVYRFNAETSKVGKWCYTIPGHGVKPDYCGKQFTAEISTCGSARHDVYAKCGLGECPDCAGLWIANTVFHAAVKIEAYAFLHGQRPARYVASVDYEQGVSDWTLSDVRAFIRNVGDRLKRERCGNKASGCGWPRQCEGCPDYDPINGIDAGNKLFHALRIKKPVQRELRDILGRGTGSGAFWIALDDPDLLQQIEDRLQWGITSWRDCVYFSPHVHGLVFPGNKKLRGDAGIVIKKLTNGDDGKVYTLDAVDDVVKHLYYLVSHCGLLTNSDRHNNQPVTHFGGLFNFHPSDVLDPDEYDKIVASVLSVLNEKRDVPLIVGKDGNLCYEHNDKDESDSDYDDYNWIPMHELIAYSALDREAIDAWVSAISGRANRDYVDYLIRRYSDILDDPDIPQKQSRLYTEDLNDPPPSFRVIVTGGVKG